MNLEINHYLSGSCNLIYPMARVSCSSYILPYNWPPKSDLLLRNSLLELKKIFNKIQKKDMCYHRSLCHQQLNGFGNGSNLLCRMSPTVWAIGSSGTAAGGGPPPVWTVLSYLSHLGSCDLFSIFFPASFQLFAGPLDDISIHIVLICECLPDIFFFIRWSSSHLLSQ